MFTRDGHIIFAIRFRITIGVKSGKSTSISSSNVPKSTGKVDLTTITNPEDFLDIVMERQGLDKLPGRFKEKWMDVTINTR